MTQSHFVPFFIGENRQVDGPGDMVFGILRRRTHIDDIRKIREGNRKIDAFGKVHAGRLYQEWEETGRIRERFCSRARRREDVVRAPRLSINAAMGQNMSFIKG